MMNASETGLELVGKSLTDFSVRTMTEVFRTNDDGLKVKAVGYFFDPQVAQGWVDGMTNKHYYGTVHVLVLTDGERAFLLDPTRVEITGDEHAKLEIRDKALAKLTPSERAVLGI
jgi:hypothetical protein